MNSAFIFNLYNATSNSDDVRVV